MHTKIDSSKRGEGLIPNPFEILERIEYRLSRIENETLPSFLKTVSKQGSGFNTGNEKLISKRDAAGLLGCSVSTIDNLRRSGKLERVNVGKSARFRLCDLQSIVRKEP